MADETALGPPPPDGLGAAGVGLWCALVEQAFEFDRYELVIVEAAARQSDDIAALERLLADQGLTVTGAAGQTRLSPVVGELRQQRLALCKMIDALALPGDDESFGKSPASRRAQRAASVRWDRDRVRRAQVGLS